MSRVRRIGAPVTIAILIAMGTLIGSAQPACALGDTHLVLRFYNERNGSHFYTASFDEATAVSRNYMHIYTYEGTAYEAYLVDDPNNPVDAPLYRFYNKRNGSHFYTVSAEEKAYVETHYSSTYTYEGVAYAVLRTGANEVYRLYNKRNGSHFYTASAEERDAVIAMWSDTYAYEGVAFCVPAHSGPRVFFSPGGPILTIP